MVIYGVYCSFIMLLYCSPLQQRRVYDKRTSQDRTAQAVNFCSKVAAGTLGIEAFKKSDIDDDLYEVGDIVALIDKEATASKPLILLGKILRTYPRKREVILAHLAPVPNTRFKYQLTVGKDSWTESFDALIYPVDIVFDEGNNVYKLRTKPEEIYKAWNGNQ